MNVLRYDMKNEIDEMGKIHNNIHYHSTLYR